MHKKIIDIGNNAKKFWKFIKNIIKKQNDKRDFPEYFMRNGQRLYEEMEIANAFCEHYTNVGKNLAQGITEGQQKSADYVKFNSPNTLFFTPTTLPEIDRLIAQLKK